MLIRRTRYPLSSWSLHLGEILTGRRRRGTSATKATDSPVSPLVAKGREQWVYSAPKSHILPPTPSLALYSLALSSSKITVTFSLPLKATEITEPQPHSQALRGPNCRPDAPCGHSAWGWGLCCHPEHVPRDLWGPALSDRSPWGARSRKLSPGPVGLSHAAHSGRLQRPVDSEAASTSPPGHSAF